MYHMGVRRLAGVAGVDGTRALRESSRSVIAS